MLRNVERRICNPETRSGRFRGTPKASILWLFISTCLFAQTEMGILKQLQSLRSLDPATSPNPPTAALTPNQGLAPDFNGLTASGFTNTTDQMVVDQPVDENKYIVGVNDEFSIYIWGTVNQQFKAAVNAEGRIVVPSIGIIDARKCTLAEVKERINKAVLKVLRKVDITITLSRIRIFRVHVTGDVQQPGSFSVSGMTRVSEVLQLCGGPANKDNARTRGIEIHNDNYPLRHADMAAFQHSNQLDFNPYLIEGDRICVSPRVRTLRIDGYVNYPGVYDFVENDNLGGLILAAGGLHRGADTSRIMLTRFMDNKDSLTHDILSVADSGFLLQQDDRIFVSGVPEYRISRQVSIEGEVRFPGLYPIRKDRTTLEEVLNRAGGLTNDADLKRSRLVRTEGRSYPDREFERLKTVPLEALLSSERLYLKTKLLEEDGRASLDLSDITTNGAGDFVLRTGDRIIIARRSLSVNISGAVRRPGLVPYKQGQGCEYYVELAGGYSSSAKQSGIRIIRNTSPTWLKRNEAKAVEPEDMIWVPERDSRQGMTNIKDALSIVSSTVTILWTIFAISSLR